MLGGTLLNLRIIFRPVSLLFCTLLCCSTGIVSAQGVDNHGNTVETATTLPLNTSVSGTIDPGNDVDYFRIDTSTPTFIAIFTTGNLDTVGSLSDGTNTFLQSDNQSGEENNFLIFYSLNPGTYYIRVRSHLFSSTGNYLLHVDVVTVTEIELNTSVSGTIGPNDVDYFNLETSTQTDVNIFTIGNLDTRGSLIDSVGNVLQIDYYSGAENNFLIRARLDPGTYYIQVGSSSSDNTGDYTLRVDVVVDDHSNTTATATTLPLNTSVSGTIDPAGDVDYFSIDISTPTFIAIFTTGNLDTRGSLYDGTNTFLKLNYFSGEGDNFLIRYRLDPGTYYIQVGSIGTGNYVLHVDVFTTTEIELNTSVSGTIDPGNDVDYFSIDISTPTLVNIFTTGDLDTFGSLLDRTNTSFQFDNNSGEEFNFLIRYRLDPGTYYIQVASLDTGNYVLHVDVVDIVDDHSDIIAMATELTLNTPVSGTIDFGNDVDYFRIDISTPTSVNIFTTGNLNTVGTLYNGTNTVLRSNNDSGEGRNFLILRRLDPGTYYIEVGGFRSRSTGDYALYVLTDDHNNTIETATTLPLNTSVSGTIAPADDVDYFSIIISTPVFVNIFTTGNLNTVGRLYDGTNTSFQFDNNSGEEFNFLILHRLDPGTYYIQVESSDQDRFSEIGDYVLHVDAIVDYHSNTIETATTLPLNTSVLGTINPAIDVDYFRIDISTPTFVNIFTTGNLNTVGTLYNGTNTLLQLNDDSGESRNFLILRRLDPGTYYIQVDTRFGDTGDYVLHVDVVDIVDDHSDTIAMATELTLNTSISGTIDFGNDVDYFRIDISTPTFVNIFTTGGLDAVGRLYNETNTFLQSDDNSGERFNFLISRYLDSGTYYIEVGNSRSRSTGDYVLHVDVVVDEHSNTIETATTLPLNTSVSGTINPAIDVDYFSIDISTPSVVKIFTTGNLDTLGRLYDGTNTFLRSNDNSGEGRNFLILPPLGPGTYYIQVGGFRSRSIGDYVLHVDVDAVDIVDDHSDTIAIATELTLNTPVSGRIDFTNDVDYFSINISTPTFVNIFTTGNLDTVGRLYDGTNTVLRSNDDSGERFNFLISRYLDSGTYYIEVGNSRSRSTGDYVLHVDVVVDNHSNTTETATILTLNIPESGRIDPAIDVDYFRIDISTPAFVNIFTTGNLDTVGTLYNGTNTILRSNDDSGEGRNFLIRHPLGPGTYYIQVGGFRSRSIGRLCPSC